MALINNEISHEDFMKMINDESHEDFMIMINDEKTI